MKRDLTLAAAAVVLAAGTTSAQQQDFSKVEVKSQKVAEGLYMLQGAGGNIGLSAGADAAFLVDDQYAPLTPKILEAVKALTDKPVKFVVNTHWHGDHTGGNENLGNAGVTIVAHDNVYRRMSTEQFISFFNEKVAASPKAALPVITFNDTATFHLNGDDLHAFHVPPAHTDGDSIVHFRKVDVFHMGDTFFNGMYPFIDVDSGGSIEGMIGAADKVLALAGDGTKIIPGHGPLATKADLKAYRDMLVAVRDAIKPLVASGKTLEQTVAAKPTAALDAKWGVGFIKPDAIVGLVYKDLSRKK
jgi:glyoxylase-like metal-dependent hydrolase (beta-lactamase superfamily II)